MPEQPHIDVLRNQPHQPLAHNASFRLASDQHDKPDNAAQRLRHLRQQTHARAAFKAGSKQKQKNELSQLEGSAKTSQPWEGSLSNAKVTAKAALAARLLTDAPNGTDAAEHVLQKGASTSKLNGNAQTSFCNIVDIRAMPNLRSMQEILIRQEPVIFRGAAEYFGLWHHVDDLTGMRTETEGTDVWSFQSLREDFGEVEVVTQATDAAGVQSIQHRRLKDFLGTFSSPAVSLLWYNAMIVGANRQALRKRCVISLTLCRQFQNACLRPICILAIHNCFTVRLCMKTQHMICFHFRFRTASTITQSKHP